MASTLFRGSCAGVAAVLAIALGVGCRKEPPPGSGASPPLVAQHPPGPATASTALAPPIPAGPVLRIDGDAIRWDGRVLLPVPADRTRGADAAFKRSGPNDLYLLPVADAFRGARAEGRIRDELVLIVTADTPYRLLIEVLFTAGQSDLSRYVIHEGSIDGRAVTTSPPPPRAPLPPPTDGPPPEADALHLAVFLISDGISLKASGGNIAPGCDAIGRGIAVPAAFGKQDLPGLVACVRRLRAAAPRFADEKSFILTTNPGTPFREVADVVLAMRGSPGAELFPIVHFGVAR